jgi:hypothetical protein
MMGPGQNPNNHDDDRFQNKPLGRFLCLSCLKRGRQSGANNLEMESKAVVPLCRPSLAALVFAERMAVMFLVESGEWPSFTA